MIAYINLQGQVCTVHPHHRQQQILTTSPHRFSFPAWSPDNATVAAIGSLQNESGLFILKPDEANGDTLPCYASPTERPFYVYWSPHGKTVSFLASHPLGLGLHLVDVGDRRHQLILIGQPCYWDWLPDATRILVHTGADKIDARLAFIDLATPGGSPAHGKSLARPGLFQVPGIATCGKFIAYSTPHSRGNGHLTVATRDLDQHTQFIHAGGLAFTWSPRREQLAFICPPKPARHFYGPLHLLDIPTNTTYMLTKASDVVLAFFWSPDGQYIAYFTMNENEPDATAPDNGRQNGHHTHTNGRTAMPEQTKPPRSDDMELTLWVIEVETKQREKLVVFRPAEVFVTQFLPFFDQYALSHQLWSPASDALVLPIIQDDSPQVATVSLRDGHLNLLAAGDMCCWSHGVSRVDSG